MICRFVSIGIHGIVPVKVLGIHPIEQIIIQTAPIPNTGKKSFFGSAAGGKVGSLAVIGFFGDNIDNTVDGIGAPQGSAGTTNDLDPIDVFEQRILHVPENT